LEPEVFLDSSHEATLVSHKRSSSLINQSINQSINHNFNVA